MRRFTLMMAVLLTALVSFAQEGTEATFDFNVLAPGVSNNNSQEGDITSDLHLTAGDVTLTISPSGKTFSPMGASSEDMIPIIRKSIIAVPPRGKNDGGAATPTSPTSHWILPTNSSSSKSGCSSVWTIWTVFSTTPWLSET